MNRRMRSIIRKVFLTALVLSLVITTTAFGYVSGDSGTLVDSSYGTDVNFDEIHAPDEAEEAIEADGAVFYDFETKVVGNDGVAYENVEYLSVGALSRLDEDTRQEYYEMCDQVAEDINSGINADVVIGVDVDGELTLYAEIQMMDICMEAASMNVETIEDENDMASGPCTISAEDSTTNETGNEDTKESKYDSRVGVDTNVVEENMDIIADKDSIPDEEIEVPGMVFDVTNTNKNYFRNQLNSNGMIVFDSLCYAAQNGSNTMTVLAGNISMGECVSAVSAAFNTYVKAFEWMDHSKNISLSLGSNRTTIKFPVSVYYSPSIESQAQSRASTIASRAREYAKSSSPNDIPYGIIEYINAWVCQFNFYNNDGLGDRDKTTQAFYNCHSSYGVLLNGYGVCESYAKATSRILDCAGIRNLYAVGDTLEGYHAWNYVFLNGSWYVLDTTFNDGGAYENKNFFLVGGAQAASHNRYPTGNHYYESIKFNYPSIAATNYSRNTYGVYDPSPEPAPAPLENPAPVIKVSSLTTAIINKSYSASIPVSGSGSINLSITSGSLPKGLTMSSGGYISGIPTVIGTYTFTVKAKNIYGSDEKVYTLRVGEEPPQILTSSLPDGMAGIRYDSRVSVSGTMPISFSIVSGSLPNGLVLNSSTGSISGVPSKGGVFTFTLRASNSSGSANKQFTVNVTVDQPEILSDSLSDAVCGEYYHDAILRCTKTPVIFEIYSGSLPDGLTMDKNEGIITGIPVKAGKYTFGVKADNGFGKSDTSTITMIVRGAPPKILSGSLPDGTVGENYRAEIEVKNGVNALLNITDGDDLPDGLRVSRNQGNIVLSGIPTRAANYSIGFLLSNSYGSDGNRYSITIKDKKKEDINPPVQPAFSGKTTVANQKSDIRGLFAGSYSKYAVSPQNLASVSNKGLLTAKKAGSITVTGCIKEGKKWVSSGESVIINIERPSFTVKTIQATRANQDIDVSQYLGGTSVKPSYWITSNKKILSLDEYTGNITTIKDGTAKITAVFGEGKNAAKYSVNVKITIPKISKTKVKLLTGASFTLKMNNTQYSPEWVSSNNAVAKVQNGKVYANGAGTSIISAIIEGVTYSCEVTVPAPMIRSQKITIKNGKVTTVGLKNTKIKANEVCWSSANTGVAVVDDKGKVRGISKGTAIIYTYTGGVYNECMVIVK